MSSSLLAILTYPPRGSQEMVYSVSPRREVSQGIGRPETEGKAMDVDPRPLGGDEMSRLVHEDEHAQNYDQRQHRQ